MHEHLLTLLMQSFALLFAHLLFQQACGLVEASDQPVRTAAALCRWLLSVMHMPMLSLPLDV